MKKSVPNQKRGFTLIELLVVIAIIAVLAAVVVLLINPIEILRRGRDSTRLSDLNNLQTAINAGLQDAGGSAATVLCYNLTPPCSGNSTDAGASVRKVNGTGWVKVNFLGQSSVTVPTLPIDPTNSSTYKYSYYSDGTNYELDATLESTQQSGKMTTDGGDNNAIYEIGSSLILLH